MLNFESCIGFIELICHSRRNDLVERDSLLRVKYKTSSFDRLLAGYYNGVHFLLILYRSKDDASRRQSVLSK